MLEKIRNSKLYQILYGSFIYRIVRRLVIIAVRIDHDVTALIARQRIRALSKKHPDNDELREIDEYLRHHKLDVFPYDFVGKYDDLLTEGHTDEDGYPYVIHNGKKLFGPKDETVEEFARYYTNIMEEQDKGSPHCYVPDESRKPMEGSIIAELGAAEALFTLEYIDSAKAAYLFECEEKWMVPLSKTFKPWKDKVEIVRKYVGGWIMNSL